MCNWRRHGGLFCKASFWSRSRFSELSYSIQKQASGPVLQGVVEPGHAVGPIASWANSDGGARPRLANLFQHLPVMRGLSWIWNNQNHPECISMYNWSQIQRYQNGINHSGNPTASISIVITSQSCAHGSSWSCSQRGAKLRGRGISTPSTARMVPVLQRRIGTHCHSSTWHYYLSKM